MRGYWNHRRTKPGEAYAQSRDTVLRRPTEFKWPNLETFNWALEWFDTYAFQNEDIALIAPNQDGREQAVTYDDMRLRSDDRATRLQHAGVRAGDVVVLVMGNIVEFWESSLALMKIRAVAVPLYPDATPSDVERIASRTDAGWILVPEQDTEQYTLRTLRVPASTGSDDLMTYEPSGPTPANHPLMIYLSSGTTGQPKAIVHTHVTYPVGHLSSLAWQGVDKGDVHMNLSQPGWAKHSWSSLFVPWTAGATVATPPAEADPAAVLDRALFLGVTSLCAPAFFWRLTLPELPRLEGRLKKAQTAGEPLDPALARQVRFALHGVELRPGYGQTEATAIAGDREGEFNLPGHVGRPLPGYDIRIVDEDGRPTTVGLVCIAVPDVGFSPVSEPRRGTWRPHGTRLYRTGDIGELHQGQLRLVGRDDDLFKRDGHHVSPTAIEAVITAHPAVEAVGVVGMPTVTGKVPVAHVVLRPDTGPTALRSVHEWTINRVSPLEVPVEYHAVHKLPLTLSGKLRRFLLPECIRWSTYQAPQSVSWESHAGTTANHI